MKCLADGYGCEDVEPQGFVSLMDLYENNFIRMKKLAPLLSTSTGSFVSSVDGCLDLHIQILESSKFTTSFLLTYYFKGPGRNESSVTAFIPEPMLKCRAYHDAGQVEVLTGHLHHGRTRYDRLPTRASKEKWRLNRLLYKWLGYCLYQGHSFPHFENDKVGISVKGLPV